MSTDQGLGPSYPRELNPLITVVRDETYEDEDDEDPPEDEQDNSLQAVSDRAWFGSRVDDQQQWGHAYYQRQGKHLTDERPDERRDVGSVGRVKVRGHRKRKRRWWRR